MPPPRIADNVAELTEGATERATVRRDDGKSGSTFELVVIDGGRYFLKTSSAPGDWLMRVTGDRDLRTFRIWEAGIMDRTPPSIDHAVVAMARDGDDPVAVLGMLIRDVGEHLVPEGDAIVAAAMHAGFLGSLAELAAVHWGWDDPLGLMTMPERIRMFAPDNIAREVDPAGGSTPEPIAAAVDGWARLADRAPRLHELAMRAHAEPGVLADALSATPSTFLHGDWKMGNLGMHPDGRTILLDWAYPGSGPICWDLAWYMAVNRARLPESKPATIERLRAELERAGVATDAWWDVQLRLSLLAMCACLGWEKALGVDDELGWWAERAEDGAELLGW